MLKLLTCYVKRKKKRKKNDYARAINLKLILHVILCNYQVKLPILLGHLGRTGDCPTFQNRNVACGYRPSQLRCLVATFHVYKRLEYISCHICVAHSSTEPFATTKRQYLLRWQHTIDPFKHTHTNERYLSRNRVPTFERRHSIYYIHLPVIIKSPIVEIRLLDLKFHNDFGGYF